MLNRCGLPLPSGLRRLTSSHSLSAQALIPARARILITSSVADAECLSACEAFQLMLQAYLQVECVVVHGSRQMVSWKPWAYYLVILLFRGLFRDPGFERILAAAFKARGRRLELVTVLADSHFDFPSLEDESVSPFLGLESESPTRKRILEA